MVFETEQNKCVVLSGVRCSYTAVSGASGDPGSTQTWREELACVANAECSSDDFCTCTDNHFETKHGRCERKEEYRDFCSSNAVDLTRNLIQLVKMESVTVILPTLSIMLQKENSSHVPDHIVTVPIYSDYDQKRECPANLKCSSFNSDYKGEEIGRCVCYGNYYETHKVH